MTRINALVAAESSAMVLRPWNVFQVAYVATAADAPASNVTRLFRMPDTAGRADGVCRHRRSDSLETFRNIVQKMARRERVFGLRVVR